MHQLTLEQIQSFSDNGYLIVRNLASADEVARMLEVTRSHLADNSAPVEYEADVQYPGAPAGRDAPGGDTVRRLLNAYQRAEIFSQWGTDQRLRARLQQLFGRQQLFLVQSHHNCVMTKQPRFSSETHWHQDARYWNFQNSELISTWLALDHEMQANGGMQLIPGTHKMHFHPDRYDAALFLREDLPDNQALIGQAVLAELFPGDVLFFHARLFHAAGRNLTAARKFALVFTYRSEGNAALKGTKSVSQPEIPL